MVELDSLEKLDTPQYHYGLQVRSNGCALYAPKALTINILSDSHTLWKRTEDVISTVSAGQPVTIVEEGMEEVDSTRGYLHVRLPDGTEGYLTKDDVEMIRTPIN